MTLFAQLFLKVNEPEEAFPYIKSVANSHPDTGKKLAEEFLRVWADSNDPNSNRNRNYRYGYMYGFNQRANSIPLTRSKQERNLTDLAKWISKIQSLPIDEINQINWLRPLLKFIAVQRSIKFLQLTKFLETLRI